MPKEPEVIICPNPNCHRKIEPILLNNLSTTPAEQYYACPNCFIKLDADAGNDENVTEESTSGPSPAHSALEKILDVISSQPQEEKMEKEEGPVKSREKEEKETSGCSHHFGYLANRPKNAPIPQECLLCQKIVDCMLKSVSR